MEYLSKQTFFIIESATNAINSWVIVYGATTKKMPWVIRDIGKWGPQKVAIGTEEW